MKLHQFIVIDTNEVSHVINSEHPINFDYANRVLGEMGVTRNVKKIIYSGTIILPDSDDMYSNLEGGTSH